MAKKSVYLVSVLLLLLWILPVALAYIGPVSYLTEQVYADYATNGTITAKTYAQCPDDSNPCRFGYVEVALPNNNDTLQTVRVNLSATTGTALNSVQSYRPAVSSYPNIWDKTKMFVNDSDFGQDQNYYNITDLEIAPVIAFKLTYANQQGGYDIYDYDNIGPGGSTNNMTFSLNVSNPSSSKSLTGVTVTIYFDINSKGANDSVNITSATVGTILDRDADGFRDTLVWNGNLDANSNQIINISAIIAETINLANGNTNMTLDSNYSHSGVRSNYTQTSSLTGITIVSNYARGPIRQGVDLAERSGGTAWDVRGFIHILAANTTQVNGTALTYNITGWNIYNVSAATGNMANSLQSGTFSSTNFTSDYGRLYTTDSDFSSNTSRAGIEGVSKPYVASAFNWSVVWNGTDDKYYVSYINTTADLPNLSKVDQVPSLAVAGYLVLDTPTLLNITQTAEYQGDPNAKGKSITILSVVPRNTSAGVSRNPYIIDNNSIVVSWYNATSSTWTVLKIGNGTSNNIAVTITQPGADNGLVNVSIPDLSNTNLSKYLEQNERINVTYNVTSPDNIQAGDAYNFTGNSTIVTVSGTPETEAPALQVIASSGRQLIGYKDLFSADPANPTLVNGTLFVQVIGNDITNIYFIDYVPQGTNFTCDVNSILFYNSTDGLTWSISNDISVNDTGTLTLPDGTVVTSCEYRNADGTGWTLGSNAAVKVMYRINITTPGLYEVPMGIAGFDPSTGSEIKTTVYGVVRVVVPEEMKEPEVRQGEFFVAKSIQVGSPVSWIKEFEVYNPNSQFVDSEFSTEVFNDAMSGYVSYLDESGKEVKEEVVFAAKNGKNHMSWKTRLYPQETRSYDIRILTPPVLETDRDMEVIRVLEDKMVELKLSIFLRSLAEEIYPNIQLNLPIQSVNILSIRDGEGRPVSYSGEDSVKVIIPQIEAKASKEISVNYKQTYPKIIVTPDKDRYGLNSQVGLDILVIHGGEEIDYPYIETEVYTSDRELVYANIQQLSKLTPISQTNISENFNIPLGASSGKYIAEARLRTEMATLATGTGNFYVSGSEAGAASWISYIMLIVALGILYMGVKRIRQSNENENTGSRRVK